MTSKFASMMSSPIFFDVVVFFLSSLVNGPSFVSILSLVLELWQFSFIKDWPEIRKSEIAPSEFWIIFGDWDELRIPNLARMSIIKLLNAAKCQRHSFHRCWVIKGKPTKRGGVKLPPSRLGLRTCHASKKFELSSSLFPQKVLKHLY